MSRLPPILSIHSCGTSIPCGYSLLVRDRPARCDIHPDQIVRLHQMVNKRIPRLSPILNEEVRPSLPPCSNKPYLVNCSTLGLGDTTFASRCSESFPHEVGCLIKNEKKPLEDTYIFVEGMEYSAFRNIQPEYMTLCGSLECANMSSNARMGSRSTGV